MFPLSAPAVEWPVFGPLEVEALIEYERLERSSNQSSDTEEFDLRTGVSIGQEGYWLDPGLLYFNYIVEPLYSNGEFRLDDMLDDRRGDFLSYNISINAMRDAVLPVSAALNFRQSSTLNLGSFGRRSESDLKQNSILLSWKNPYFPMSFRFDERDRYSVSISGLDGRAFVRDDLEKIFTIRGSSSKLWVEVENRQLDDRSTERNNDFDLDRINARHNFHWGSGSELESRFRFYDRTGFNPVERLEWTEMARIRHGGNFDSETRYSFRSAEQISQSTTQTGQFKLRHRLYRNLTTTGSLLGEQIRSDEFDQDEQRIGLDIAYQKSDFMGSSVTARWAGFASDTDLDSKAGQVSIVDENQPVPLTGGIVLDRRFIAVGSIIVTDVTSSIVYAEGIDYEIFELTDNLTQLQVLPGGQIESGDTLLISYTAAVLPSLEYSAFNQATGFTFRKGWLSISHHEIRTDFDVSSGPRQGFLADTRDRTTRMDIQWNTGGTSNQFSAENRSYSNGPLGFTVDTLTQSITFNLSPNVMTNFRLTGSRTDSTVEDIKLYVADLNVTWRPSPYWTIRPAISVWKRDAERMDVANFTREEEILSASLDVRWRFRKIFMNFSFRHNDRSADGSDYVDDNVFLSVRRQF